jgi:hypothetical protein
VYAIPRRGAAPAAFVRLPEVPTFRRFGITGPVGAAKPVPVT